MSSPRTWGCFPAEEGRVSPNLVFPTHVGVFPCQVYRAPTTCSLPHARGGVSSTGVPPLGIKGSSPRTWGCFFRCIWKCIYIIVFPTHVGVFLISKYHCQRSKCLPHARGGVSLDLFMAEEEDASSPRTWGCFFAVASPARVLAVFPTHVGVFLIPM